MIIHNILITGASSGIGKALAIFYASSCDSQKMNLFLCARNQERLEEVANECRNLGANVISEIFDITNREACFNFIKKIEEKYAIELVIANAGISGGTSGVSEGIEMTDQIFKTNIDGVMNIIHPAIEYMKLRKCGQIAIMSSLAGFIGIPSSPAYSSSKAAVRIYAEGIRVNLKSFNIKVSAICPGYVESSITKKNKFWMPLLMKNNKAAKIIASGLKKNKARIAFPLSIYLILLFTSLLPQSLVNLILSKLKKS